MLVQPNCAICQDQAWDVLGTKEYLKGEVPEDSYNKIRHDVLFQLWFPGENGVKITPILCRNCGFLCYQPRPEESDINLKYEYIANHHEASTEFSTQRESDIPRSRELFRYLSPYLNQRPMTILDYGGGTGKLLRYFVKAGHDCSTLDLVDQTLTGVNYAGSQISDLANREPFDMLICSHVLEHLAKPLETLIELTKYVRAEGFVYVEVPSEIWHRPPPSIDPVTHINFFTSDSLRTLLEHAGINVILCHYQEFTRPNSKIGLAIKAIGKPSRRGEKTALRLLGAHQAYAQLRPTIWQRICRILRHPRLILNLLPQNN